MLGGLVLGFSGIQIKKTSILGEVTYPPYKFKYLSFTSQCGTQLNNLPSRMKPPPDFGPFVRHI